MPLPPDADLHDEATGPAKTLVNKNDKPQAVKLYAGWFCPFGSFQNDFVAKSALNISSSACLDSPRRKKYPISVY